jgi:hypothetical protein
MLCGIKIQGNHLIYPGDSFENSSDSKIFVVEGFLDGLVQTILYEKGSKIHQKTETKQLIKVEDISQMKRVVASTDAELLWHPLVRVVNEKHSISFPLHSTEDILVRFGKDIREFVQSSFKKSKRTMCWKLPILDDFQLNSFSQYFEPRRNEWRKSYHVKISATEVDFLLGPYSYNDLTGWGCKIEDDKSFFSATYLIFSRKKHTISITVDYFLFNSSGRNQSFTRAGR